MKLKVATLAVGTEITDGQITDRNSTILSQFATDLGFSVIEHRAVPDDRELIISGLESLGAKTDILFVTGGLGPTSDDFTRELIAEYVGQPLEFIAEAWAHVVSILKSRGVDAREVQKQQCYFPKGATIHANPAGTANGFSVKKGNLKIFALPGPPAEIVAVWKDSLESEVKNLVAAEDREVLRIWRCLGRGESDIAEMVEPIARKAGLKIGYRAHAPYVEVKVWSKFTDEVDDFISQFDQILSPYLVNRDNEDLAHDFLKLSSRCEEIEIQDLSTFGFLSERLFNSAREQNLNLKMKFVTSTSKLENFSTADLDLRLESDVSEQEWLVAVSRKGKLLQSKKFKPIYNHKVNSERGRKYICEKALQFAVSVLANLK